MCLTQHTQGIEVADRFLSATLEGFPISCTKSIRFILPKSYYVMTFAAKKSKIFNTAKKKRGKLSNKEILLLPVAIYINFCYICTMKEERKILFYKDYFISFYRSLDGGAQKKLDYVLGMLKIQERISEKFVKFIRDGIYEIRASYDGNIYRAFFIFDEGNIVMLFNGFQKKTQKTPESEINKALELKKEYYAGKK